MLISKVGEAKVRLRLERLRNDLSQMSDDAGEIYKTGGDGWHDNPSWHDITAERRKVSDYYNALDSGLNSTDLAYIDDLDPQTQCGVVGIGSKVTVQFEDEPEDSIFIVLGPAEIDTAQGHISYEAPLAKALLGRRPGDMANCDGRLMTISSTERWEELV